MSCKIQIYQSFRLVYSLGLQQRAAKLRMSYSIMLYTALSTHGIKSILQKLIAANYKWRSGGIKKFAKGNKTSHWEELETEPGTQELGVTQYPGPHHLPAVQRWNHSSSEAVEVWQADFSEAKIQSRRIILPLFKLAKLLETVNLSGLFKCHRDCSPSSGLGHISFRRKPSLGRVVPSTSAVMWPAGCTSSVV